MNNPRALISLDFLVGPWTSDHATGAGQLREVLELTDHLAVALGALLESEDELQFIAPDGLPHLIRFTGIHAAILEDLEL